MADLEHLSQSVNRPGMNETDQSIGGSNIHSYGARIRFECWQVTALFAWVTQILGFRIIIRSA